MDNHQRPIAQHMELCSMLRGSLDGRAVWGRIDTCKCMAEVLHCSSETTTTLLIVIPQYKIQSLKFKKKKKISLWGGHFCRKVMVEGLQNAIKAFLPGQACCSSHQEQILVCTLFYIPGYVPVSPGL